MTSTYEKIASTTLGSAGNLSFTSIPSIYTDLVLVASSPGATSIGNVIGLRFNNDTGTNYSDTILYGTGTAAGSTRNTSASYIMALYYFGLKSDQSTLIYNIMNYANTTTYKTTLIRANSGQEPDAIVGLWRSTSAINRIDLFVNTSTFVSGSAFTLYGIKAE
jgi:hypothetical protein